MSEKFNKEQNEIVNIEKKREDKLLDFLGGKFVLYLLLVVILIGIAIFIYTEISYIFEPFKMIIASVISPIILSYVFYYVLNPLVNIFAKKMSRTLASMLAILVAILVLFVVIIGMVPIIVEQTENLVKAVPGYVESIKSYLDTNSDNTYVKAANHYMSENLNTAKISSTALATFSSFAKNLATTVSSTASILMTVPFVLFFLLKDATVFKKYVVSSLPKKMRKPFDSTLDEIDDKVGSYIQGQMLVSLCIGVMLFIGYNIIGLNYAFSLATIASFLSVVPYLGPILAIIPAMLVAASTSWVMMVKMLVVWGVVQFFEGNILSPQIMGKSMKMHPLTVIFVILIGVSLFGVVGAILGIPGYSILKILATKVVNAIKARYERYYSE